MIEETPNQVADVLNELSAWLATHPGLPSFCFGTLARSSWDDAWDLTLRVTCPDNGQALIGLARWAIALDGALTISAPHDTGTDVYQQLTAAGRVGEAIRLEAWTQITVRKGADP